MISNYIKVASRNILRNKLYSFINSCGLSIGIAFCMLIYLFILDEKSFDQFHINKDRIYRMHGVQYNPTLAADPEAESPFNKIGVMQLGLAPAMKAEFPEVQYATHFCGSNGVIQYQDKLFKEEFTYVDADFFKMFTFPLLHGNANTLFNTKDEIVLTQELADKYFGTEEALGKTITLQDRELLVTGIIENPPANSSLDFKALVPIEGWHAYSDHNLTHWLNMGFPTFVQLHPNSTTTQLPARLDQLLEKYMADDLKNWRERSNVPAIYKPYQIGFSKLTDIHMQKDIGWTRVSDPQYSWILGGIALLILVIACINYISLSLTTSARRRMEVGIRKTAGARRSQLISQFSLESVILSLISMVIACGLVVLFLPSFNSFTGKEIELHTVDLIALLGVCTGITLLVGLVAGSYPALFLSGFKPALVLKGLFTSKVSAGFTKPLVVLQFVMSAFLTISSVIMYRQMHYITTKDLGYNQHQVIVIPLQPKRDEDTRAILERFRQKVSANPSVSSVSGTDYPFAGGDYMVYGYKLNGEEKSTYGYTVDASYLSTMGIQLLQGRNFDNNSPADEKSIIINETFVKDMGWDNPLNEQLAYHGMDTSQFRVIGVVKDFHFLSLEQQIEPMLLTQDGWLSHMLVKISPENIPGTLEQLREAFNEVNPGKPFDYSFMDENVAHQYTSFDRWMSIMSLATGFAIFISSLGLFGLAGINALNRTKEIGIRKVMGASLTNIFVMLNRQYVWFSIIAFIIAAPLSWYVASRWLDHFKFRIEMSWELFVIAMLGGMLFALLAVSYHAVKSALVNPAETLKYE